MKDAKGDDHLGAIEIRGQGYQKSQGQDAQSPFGVACGEINTEAGKEYKRVRSFPNQVVWLCLLSYYRRVPSIIDHRNR
jgi:hypothetical protein